MKVVSLFKWHMPVVAHSTAEMPSKYVDLAPTDDADEYGIYADALLVATRNRNVSNIALTGPYGSGKSSIIKTFRRRYKRPVLQTSLAAFLPEADGSVTTNEDQVASPKKGNVSKQEIERSILQQMLYGADSNSLPLSRFKRIQTPKWWSKFTSLFIMAGLFSCWRLFSERENILSGQFFKPLELTNWLNLMIAAVGFLFIWLVFHQLYIKSLGLSLKSISLKDIEITPETAKEESILNRHLDEIIYFFQATKYDLVIIEDLDRFNNPEIFVTLREINSLVNANAGVKRPIRFLYALRDNMFVNTDRTKFFEFIVPVIPIINSSNSIDKVIEQGQRLALDKRLDGQFLREVSRYLSDLRLIHNIFNEYTIYVANLETDGENVLDTNKLLAILIYKNVLPSDFEDLHREKGKLADILVRHGEFIVNTETQYKKRISELECQISEAEKLVPSNLAELRKIYAMALIAKIPAGFSHIAGPNGENIPFQALPDHADFEDVISQNRIAVSRPGYSSSREGVDIRGFQNGVSDVLTYNDRKALIERKSAEFLEDATKEIRDLRRKIAALRTAQFNAIIRENLSATEGLFAEFGENSDLVRFLVLEGYLDDTYYQYTSLFHRGRLSPSDNKFLIQIRSFKNPDPDFQIDNPREVIGAMRQDDFRQSFILNKTLVDCMFGDPTQYRAQIEKMIEYVSSNFAQCEAFFSTYYQTGKCNAELLSALAAKWPNFVSTAVAAPTGAVHVARVFAHLPEKDLKTLANKANGLPEFLAGNIARILSLQIDFDPGRLAFFKFETEELESTRPYPAAARVLSDNGLFKLTFGNVDFIYDEVIGFKGAVGLQTKHYSTVLQAAYVPMIEKVHGAFAHYFHTFLLRSANAEEDVSVIFDVIAHDEIKAKYLEQFVGQQRAMLPSLENVPDRLRSALFSLRKIEPTWGNCLTFMSGDSFDAQILTSYLLDQNVCSRLSQVLIDSGEGALPLRQFLFDRSEFHVQAYRTYLGVLPNKFRQFSDAVDLEKLRVLIDERAVSFSEQSFSFLEGNDDLRVSFAAKNIDEYDAIADTLVVDDEFREKLLASNISDEHKLKIIDQMEPIALAISAHRASLVGQVFYRTGTFVKDLTVEAAQTMIASANQADIQIGLFNMFQHLLSDVEVRSVIAELPKPYSEIEPGWRQPTIANTPENIEFVRWLQVRKLISSVKVSSSFFVDDIRIYNVRK